MLDTLPPDLRAALADRDGLRRQIAARQAELDDPETVSPDDCVNLYTELEQLRAAIPAADAAVSAARLAAGAELDAQAAGGLRQLLAGFAGRAEVALAQLDALACAPDRRRAVAAHDAGDVDAAALAHAAGATACEAANAHTSCPYASADWCPRRAARALYQAAAAHLAPREEGGAGTPPDATDLVLAHLRYRDRVPLRAVDAYQAVRAHLARRPATIATKAGPVVFRGDERVLVLHGYTGLGKTVAATYALARLGGVYLTSYDLGAVGQDPALPTRAQLRAAAVVVIDQVGRAWSQGYAQQVMEWLIDARYDSRTGLTILCGNFVAPAEAEVNDVVASRMAKYGRYVLCDGDDLRRPG